MSRDLSSWNPFVSLQITVPGFKTLLHPTSTPSANIAPTFFMPVSISSSPFFITTKVLSDFTFEVIDPAPIWEALLQAKRERKDICAAALGFHYAVVSMVTDMAERMKVKQVVLAGGCFANRILLETCTKELQERDFQVYYNEAVSCGDGGISLGQAYYGLLRSSLCV